MRDFKLIYEDGTVFKVQYRTRNELFTNLKRQMIESAKSTGLGSKIVVDNELFIATEIDKSEEITIKIGEV